MKSGLGERGRDRTKRRPHERRIYPQEPRVVRGSKLKHRSLERVNHGLPLPKHPVLVL